MRKPFASELKAIEEMTYALLPNLWKFIIESPARLPTLLPETLGMIAGTAVFYALQCDVGSIRREIAEYLRISLSYRPEIHNYEGFHVLCYLLNGNYGDEEF